ncbi:MAG: hypothetical protein HGA75_14740 [Thiobacillus sp.]|nr:hypothetical protein [Thiobacillus sp.]
MSGSRIPCRLAGDGFWPSARTPGPLGLNDQGDPNICSLLGDTPGVLGCKDVGDPTLAPLQPIRGAGLSQMIRLADGTALAMPFGVLEPAQTRAPWMRFAEEQARQHKGAKENVIEKTSNYNKVLGTGQSTLVGSEHAWCAAFVNWCLKQAGYDIDNDSFADRKAAMGRAHAFYEVQKDKLKKGEKSAPLVRNPLYVKLAAPVFGAIALVTNRGGHGHHAGFVYSKPAANTVVLLGGNQGDTIKFTEFNIEAVPARTVEVKGKKTTIPGKPDHLMFFVPASYEAYAEADTQPLGSDSAQALNKTFGITSASGGGRETTR